MANWASSGDISLIADLSQARAALEASSRTFFIPIVGLPPRLQEAVASAYLCLRAIDEIEDHDQLGGQVRAGLLRGISRLLQTDCPADELRSLRASVPGLPEVTQQLPAWLAMAPPDIAARIWDVTAAMADRMADWVQCGWSIGGRSDLDRYTFSVAGAVGLLLCDLWAWYDGTATSRADAVGFGRGLQATNIVLNRHADLARGADFYPAGWTDADMRAYAAGNLELAEAYHAQLPVGPVRLFCSIPLALAWASLEAHAAGRGKLCRAEVEQLVAECHAALT
jgi:farnesyl-diphosphate farnesyltransferase